MSDCQSHNHSHDHDHSDPMHNCAQGVTDKRRLLIAFFIIAGFMVLEIVGGLISSSLALLADAGHMAADAGALALALAAKWLADAKPKDANNYTFGMQRAQVLAGFLNGFMLLLLVGWLFFEAIGRLFNPVEILPLYMLPIAVVGLLANFAAFWILHQGNMNDLNMRGAMLHVVADIFGSVAAIISAIVIFFTQWYFIDAVLTLIVSFLIVKSAMPLLKQAARVLLQGAPEDFNAEQLSTTLKEAVPLIENIHGVEIWMLTPEEPRLAMHITVRKAESASVVLRSVKRILAQEFKLEHSTIQIENMECPDKKVFHDDPAGEDYARKPIQNIGSKQKLSGKFGAHT